MGAAVERPAGADGELRLYPGALVQSGTAADVARRPQRRPRRVAQVQRHRQGPHFILSLNVDFELTSLLD